MGELAMKRVLWLCLALLVFPLLTGMSSSFDVVADLEKPGGPYFSLEKKKFLWMTEQGVLLNSFSVVEKREGQWDYTRPLWQFSLAPGSALKVGQIQYGKTPAGFKETAEAKPLVSGTQYQAYGIGSGASGGKTFVMK
jgi:hypothetical protein